MRGRTLFSTRMLTLQLTDRANCPGCHAPTVAPRYSSPFAADPVRAYLLDFYGGRLDPDTLDGDYALVDCPRCGLLYQLRVPAAAAVAGFYEFVVAAERDDVERRRGSTVRYGARLDLGRTARRLRRSVSTVDVLDYGAGTGVWLDAAAALGCRTTGAEVDPAARAHLEAAGHAAVDHDELPASTYDLVNLEQVLEHVLDPLTVLERVGRSVRPDGLVRVSVPNGAQVRTLLEAPDWTAAKGSDASLNPVAPLEHVNCFDHRSLTAVGVAAGLEPFQFTFGVDLAGSTDLRSVLGALRRLVVPPAGTLVWFRRPA